MAKLDNRYNETERSIAFDEPENRSSNGSFIIPPFAALINDRMVVPSANTPYFAVEQHFFYNCLRPVVRRIYVDHAWYLVNYPDVRAAIDKGTVNDPADHYSRFGYYEHRLPYAIKVDAAWYLDVYADVKEAIQRRVFSSAQNHFEVIGYKEGRLPHSDFHLQLNERA